MIFVAKSTHEISQGKRVPPIATAVLLSPCLGRNSAVDEMSQVTPNAAVVKPINITSPIKINSIETPITGTPVKSKKWEHDSPLLARSSGSQSSSSTDSTPIEISEDQQQQQINGITMDNSNNKHSKNLDGIQTYK